MDFALLIFGFLLILFPFEEIFKGLKDLKLVGLPVQHIIASIGGVIVFLATSL